MSDSIPIVSFNPREGRALSFEMISLLGNTLDKPEAPHRHDFYSLLLLFAGECRQMVDFKIYTVQPAQVLLMPKGCVHFGHFPTDTSGFFLLFTADLFEAHLWESLQQLTLFNPLYDSPLVRFDSDSWEIIDKMAQLLYQEYRASASASNNQLLQYLLFSLLLKIERVHIVSNVYQPTALDSCFHEFMTLLNAHFRFEHSVGFYAERLHVSPKKLSRLLMERGGKSTADYITERLLLEARRLLTYSGQSVKEIAYDLGFADPFYFSRLFKKKLGLSPEAFRLSQLRG